MPRLMMPSLVLFLIFSIPFVATAYGQEGQELSLDDIMVIIPQFDELVGDPFQRVTADVGTFAAERGILIVGALAYLGIFYVVGKVAGGIAKRVIEKWVAGPIAQKLELSWNKKKEGDEDDEDDEESLSNPKTLIPKTISWFFYVIGIVAAVNTLGLPEFADALAIVGLWIPKLIAAIVIIVLGTVFVKFALAWIVERKWFGKESEDFKTMATALKVIVYSMVIAIALTTIDIGEDIIPVLVQAFAWALAGAFVIAVGWGMKDFVPNWWMGRENKGMGIVIGNKIETNKDEGTIDKIGREQFRIKTSDEKYVIVPHKDMLDVHYAITESKKSNGHIDDQTGEKVVESEK